MRRFISALLVVALALSCAAPGVEVTPQPGDFAYLQVDLQG